MDVAIIFLGAGVCTVLSRRLHGTPVAARDDAAGAITSSLRLLTVSAGLSIALFSISVLELIPSTFIIWIKGGAILWVYHFILWGMVLHCFLLVPTACLMAIAQHIRPPACNSSDPDDEEHKKRSFRHKHWIHVLLYRPIIVVLGTLLQLVLCLFDPCLKRRGTNINHASSTAMPLTASITSSATGATTPAMGNSSSLSSTTVNNHAKTTSTTWSAWHYSCTTAYGHPTIRKRMLFGTLLTSGCTYMALSRMRPWVIHISDELKLEESLFQIAISSLCAVGILLSACLNGFGSVSLPYSCLLGFVLHPVSDEAIRNAEKELEAVRSRLGGLLEQLPQRSMRRNASSGKDAVVSGDLRGMRRNISTDVIFTTIDLETVGSDDVVFEQYPEYRRKVQADFLLSLIADIVADIDEMKYVKTWSTKRGCVRRVSGVVFSAILLLRLGTAFVNVCFPPGNLPSSSSSPSSPLLALMLTYATSTVNTDDYSATQAAADQQQQLAQVLSVFLTAILSATQLQTFVASASALQRRLLRSCCGSCAHQHQLSSSSVVPAPMTSVLMLWTHHIVGWLLCCYSLACVVLTKQMMGSEVDDLSEHLYLKFHIDRFAVDLTYGVSAILSVSVLAIVLGILRANSQRYANDTAAAAANSSPRGMVEV